MRDEIKPEEQSLAEPDEPRATLSEKAIPFLVLAIVLALDQISKYFIEHSLQVNQSWAPIPSIESVFRITHVTNTGAAFGFFRSGGNLFMVVAVVVTAAIVIYNHQLSGGQRLFRVALGLQMSGALGNFIDRIRIGHVTDFLDFGPWPVFNLADLSIVSGVVALVLLMLLESREQGDSTEEDESPIVSVDRDLRDQSEDRNMLWNE